MMESTVQKQSRRLWRVLQGIAGLILFAFTTSNSWLLPAEAMAPSKSWEELQVTEGAVIRDHRTELEPYTPSQSAQPPLGHTSHPIEYQLSVPPLAYTDGGLPCNGVETRQQLVDAVAICKTVTVSPNVEINLSRPGVPDAALLIPDGVTLFGGRSATASGALLYLDPPPPMERRIETHRSMLSIGANTRVSGFRLRGYNQFNTTDNNDRTSAILTRPGVDGITIDNNEIFGWPFAGVEVREAPNALDTAYRIRVTDNYIHHNVQCGLGYGVVIYTRGFTLIDRNTFDYNRHAIAGNGSDGSGYVATLNFVLTSGPTCEGTLGADYYNQHFDMHGRGDGGYGGGAGDSIDIRRNAIRGDQSYYLGFSNRPAFMLRGTPDRVAIFAENAVAHEDEDAAVRVKGADGDTLKRQGRLIVTDNRYGIDTAAELAVGDFDGDGRTDVFQATGAVWVYSPAGRREWRFLNNSMLRLDRLAFGDFNGDGKTDVFTQSGDQWLVSDAGTGHWTPLPAGSTIPMREYRFGDFDGDKKTDVFRANGSQFFISSGGATPWRPLAASGYRVVDLRFGDFDGDGRTDVFSLANDQWSVSDGGVGHWRRLNATLSSRLDDLVFADFDGDGRTDIAIQASDGWLVSWAGATPWQRLRNTSDLLTGTLIGDFDGDRNADVLTHRKTIVGGGFGLGSRADARLRRPSPHQIMDLTRFELSSRGTGSPVIWSQQDMR